MAAAVAELPLDYLEAKFNDSDDEESQATTVAAAGAEAGSAQPAAADAEQQLPQVGEEAWDEEEDWSDSDDDDLADALEWADSRDGARDRGGAAHGAAMPACLAPRLAAKRGAPWCVRSPGP
jgi:RIO kinase 1